MTAKPKIEVLGAVAITLAFAAVVVVFIARSSGPATVSIPTVAVNSSSANGAQAMGPSRAAPVAAAGSTVAPIVLPWAAKSGSSLKIGSVDGSATAVRSTPSLANSLASLPQIPAANRTNLNTAAMSLEATNGAAPASVSLASANDVSEIATASVPAGIEPPPLELERARAEAQTQPDSKEQITIETGFECSPKMEVRRISPTHFAIQVPSPHWFMFRAHGVAGKTIRFDMVYPGTGLPAWATLNPVYTYASDLDDPATYAINEKVVVSPNAFERAWNGSLLPSTIAQQWHFICNAWADDAQAMSFVQSFDESDVCISMRLPYPPKFNERYLQKLQTKSCESTVEIGQTPLNRPLLLAKIGETIKVADRAKPCVLFYAGEHGDEPDGMWVAHDLVEYLVSGDPHAAELRQKFTFLIIPTLDPDTIALGAHQDLLPRFQVKLEDAVSIAYANWFQAWVNAGNRLDLVFNFHNLQSSEGVHVECPLVEAYGVRGTAAWAIHETFVQQLENAGFEARLRPWMRGMSPDRLDGWLSRFFGPATIAYEFNTQAPHRHLSQSDLEDVAKILSTSVARFFDTTDAKPLLDDVTAHRQKRTLQWADYIRSTTPDKKDAIRAESEAIDGATNDDIKMENLIP